MHLKNFRLLILSVFALCVYTLSASAKAPAMSEYFRYDTAGDKNRVTDKDVFVLDTLSVVGKPVKNEELNLSKDGNFLRTNSRPDLEPRKRHFRDIEIQIVTDIGPDDLLSTLNLAGPAELVQKLQTTTQFGGVNIYIKSGLAWRVNKDLSFIVPYARGRLFGAAVSYKSPTSWSRKLSYSYFQD